MMNLCYATGLFKSSTINNSRNYYVCCILIKKRLGSKLDMRNLYGLISVFSESIREKTNWADPTSFLTFSNFSGWTPTEKPWRRRGQERKSTEKQRRIEKKRCWHQHNLFNLISVDPTLPRNKFRNYRSDFSDS